MRVLLLCCLAAAIALFSFYTPAPFTVKGKVLDDKGVPLPGATVKEKGKSTATQTDINGDFSLTVSSEKAHIQIMAIGFATKEVKVNGQETVKISLKPAANALEEVVVTGYTTQRKKNITGSVSTIKMDEYRGSTAVPPSTGYVGRVRGVNIQENTNKAFWNAPKTANNNMGDDKEFNTEEYNAITDNRFLSVNENPLSTFSIDVDAAAYSNIRRYLQDGQLPPAGAVRIEEMINYFHYEYPQPTGEDPFSINTEISNCPWNSNHKLVLVGLQGKNIPLDDLPPSNLVFLIDVSGSMDEPNKLPLVKASMKLLVDQLREKDHVAIVVYAGNAGLVLPSTTGDKKTTIKNAIDNLEAGGSTAGGAGIQLAYKIAKQHFIEKGNNRIILCTDGDFNVGVSSNASLDELVTKERESGVFLTALGYGMGNYKDSKMQVLADKGNGNHAYIDNFMEAKKVLVTEFGGTLFTIAKDVKLQVEFNPANVQSYRLIGYEKRLLNKEDFNNDKKDAGELGSGHTVTALYEIIPAGAENEFNENVDPLKYQQKEKKTSSIAGNELMTIKFRYKQPDGNTSKLLEHAVKTTDVAISNTSTNFRFAAAVAEFGMLLRNSEFKEQSSYGNAWKLAKNAMGDDTEGYRAEFLKLLKNAQSIAKNKTPGEEEVETIGEGANRK